MNGIQHPTEPIPAAFGISGERAKHFRGILEDDPVAIAAFGIPIAMATVIGVNWLLPASVANFFHPFWRVVLPLIPAFHFTAAIQRRRKANAMREKDYLQFTNYQSAVQTYQSAMKTYRNLQRETRYQEIRKRRQGERQLRQEGEAKWRQLDGRAFELEVVKTLFSKGYEVEHTGANLRGDEGVDFVVRVNGKRIIGQCKAHKSYLSAGFVRELYGTLLHEKADEAWLIGTSGFYSGARSFASGKPIRLMTVRDLLRLPEVKKPSGVTKEGQPANNGVARTR